MGQQKPKVFTSTAGEARRGAELCRENARRFVRNATILLERGGSDGLAYVLWSFAVEEIGKGVLLLEQVSPNANPSDRIQLALSMDHIEKFKAGVQSVPGLDSQRFENLLQVTSNSRATNLAVTSPHNAGTTLSVGPSTTGTFSSVEDGELDPTVELRMALLYVNWHPLNRQFFRPGQTIRLPDFVGRWELSREDLISALRAVENHVQESTT